MDLFDFTEPEPSEPPPPAVPVKKEVPHSEWNEVPAALFLSWSLGMQLAYCAARDEDAALHCWTAEEAEWYRDRAAAYRGEIQ